MQRQSWSFATFRRLQFLSIETITIFFSFQRQSSQLACGDNHGHPLSLFSRLLQSSLSSRDNQVYWHAKTIMVIRFHCFQDYYSLLCLPETIKSIGMRRQSWSSAFVVFKIIIVFFAFQRQSSLLACKNNHSHPLSLFSTLLQSSLPSRDNQVRWHAETIMVIRFRCFQDYQNLLSCRDYQCLPLFIFSKTIRVFHRDFDVSLTLQDFKVFCWYTWCLLCSFCWQVSLIGFPLMTGRMVRSLERNQCLYLYFSYISNKK